MFLSLFPWDTPEPGHVTRGVDDKNIWAKKRDSLRRPSARATRGNYLGRASTWATGRHETRTIHHMDDERHTIGARIRDHF